MLLARSGKPNTAGKNLANMSWKKIADMMTPAPPTIPRTFALAVKALHHAGRNV